MTLNKVPYNEHRAQGPCHSGPQNSLFFGGITTLVNYGKITVLQNTQLFNQLNIIYAVTYKKKDPKHTVFYEYVKRKYSYADDDCMRLHNAMKQDKEDAQVRLLTTEILVGGVRAHAYRLYFVNIVPKRTCASSLSCFIAL
jgi:hypothetical protein